jgi:hypothetical protein
MVMSINLLTIADGFGDSTAGPVWYPNYVKWPEIIKLMTRGVNLLNLSRYGAGNEYIINCLKNHWHNQDLVLIQWAQPTRLDLILSHDEKYTEFWQNEIKNDPVYKNNIVQIGQDNMWISSSSSTTAISEYHNKFIGCRQHQLRSQWYIDYAGLLLNNIPYGFLLSTASEYLSNTINNHDHWHWHDKFQGMCEFRHQSKYADLDLNLTQPIPLIQFDFIKKFLQPKLNLPWRNEKELQAVEKMLLRKYHEAVKHKTQ